MSSGYAVRVRNPDRQNPGGIRLGGGLRSPSDPVSLYHKYYSTNNRPYSRDAVLGLVLSFLSAESVENLVVSLAGMLKSRDQRGRETTFLVSVSVSVSVSQ